MKTLEQKAKAYDEVLERARKELDACGSQNCDAARQIFRLFPELTESEDERIKNIIKNSLKVYFEGNLAIGTNDTDYAECLAWLEKQGEHKPDTQHSTEWSVYDFRTWQYIVSDVLTKKDGIGQYLDSGECKKIAKYMQEEWGEKLGKEQTQEELRKGEDFGIDGLYAAIDILKKTLGKVDGYQTDDGILEHKCAINATKELSKQKPVWSEEDKSRITTICTYLQDYARLSGSELRTTRINEYCDWLKSLRPQNTTVTDEELAQAKKDAYNDVLDKLEYDSENPTFDDGWSAAIWYLKKRNAQFKNTWKPSDAQMASITCAVRKMKESACYDSELVSLLNDLKKL